VNDAAKRGNAELKAVLGLGPGGNAWASVDGGTSGDPDLEWLDGSCWRPRKHGPRPCDARDYVDHTECLKACFNADWEETSGHSFLNKSLAGQRATAFGSSTMTATEIAQIRPILEKWYPMLIRIFTYYSCIGADVTNNINGIPPAGYSLLLSDAKLDLSGSNADEGLSAFAKTRDGDGWDLLWVSVNTSKESKSQSEWNDKNRLTRGEFLEFIVRASVSEGVQPEYMARNVQHFCDELVIYLASRSEADQIFRRADQFRRENCYRRETDAMLKHHEESLRNVFSIYAEKGAGGIEVDGSTDMLSCAQWMALMRDVGFPKECGVRNLYLIFAQSRMTSIHEDSSKKSTQQLNQLTYEGFLEAMVRLSLLKALPSDKEMKKHNFQYPGEYIGAILNRGAVMLEAWVTASKRGQVLGRADPIFRRLDMLILLIVGVMQFGVELQPGGPSLLLRGHPDEILSYEEVKRYWKKPTRNVFEAGIGGGNTNTGAGGPSKSSL